MRDKAQSVGQVVVHIAFLRSNSPEARFVDVARRTYVIVEKYLADVLSRAYFVHNEREGNAIELSNLSIWSQSGQLPILLPNISDNC